MAAAARVDACADRTGRLRRMPRRYMHGLRESRPDLISCWTAKAHSYGGDEMKVSSKVSLAAGVLATLWAVAVVFAARPAAQEQPRMRESIVGKKAGVY